MRVTVRLFARLRDIAGASELAREVAPGATIGDVWRQLAGEFPELARLRALDFERGQRRLRADGSAWSATATKSRFCRRFREDETSTQSALSTQRTIFSAVSAVSALTS